MRSVQVRPWLVLPVIWLGACQASSTAPNPDGPPPPATEDAGDDALTQATRALEQGDLPKARRLLVEHLEDDPDDGRARYLLARALADMREARAARVEVTRAIEKRSNDPLAWSLLGEVQEQLGEHAAAAQAYARVHQIVPGALDPLLGLARCLLVLGDAQGALATLEVARNRSVGQGEVHGQAPTDPITELLVFQALRRLGRSQEAEAIARGFLALTEDRREHAERALEVRTWLASRSAPLEPEAKQAMVEAALAGFRLRLPGGEPGEDGVLGGGPERLLAFDERPVFVTVVAPGRAQVFRGRGRGRSLAGALKGAILAVQERPGFTPLVALDASIQIEVGHTLEPVTFRSGARSLEADPPVIRGRHGLILRAEGQELTVLPGEVLSEGLGGLEAMLDHAATQAGLPKQAWRAAQATFRFETDAWLSPGPGLALVQIDGVEPMPLPTPTPGELRGAALTAARWLTAQLSTEGAVATSFDPLTGRTSGVEADVGAEALIARAFLAAHELDRDPILVAAAAHLLDRVVARLGLPEHPAAVTAPSLGELAQAVLALRRLGERPLGASEPLRAAVVRSALERLRTGRPDERERGLVALALASEERDAAEVQRAGDLFRDAVRGPLDPGLVVALVDGVDVATQGIDVRQVVGAWASAELERPRCLPLASEPAQDRAWRLAALARAARLEGRGGGTLRDAVLDQALAVVALQLGPRHKHLVRSAEQSLGGVRQEPTRIELHPVDAAAVTLALVEAQSVLSE